MRYASIRDLDISNGSGVGVATFVQGCPFHCYNCFNPETWDFNGGKEWTQEIEDKFLELANRHYIKRVSILGGEPLAKQNLDGVLGLVNKIHLLLPDKKIWLYTGFTFDWLKKEYEKNLLLEEIYKWTMLFNENNENKIRWEIVSKCNILVDGRYIESKRNLSKKWAGSDNQRVIDVFESLKRDKVILYCD